CCLCSMGHAVELWKVEWLDPLHPAFGEHFGVCQYQGALVQPFAYDEWHASLSPSGVRHPRITAELAAPSGLPRSGLSSTWAATAVHHGRSRCRGRPYCRLLMGQAIYAPRCKLSSSGITNPVPDRNASLSSVWKS